MKQLSTYISSTSLDFHIPYNSSPYMCILIFQVVIIIITHFRFNKENIRIVEFRLIDLSNDEPHKKQTNISQC